MPATASGGGDPRKDAGTDLEAGSQSDSDLDRKDAGTDLDVGSQSDSDLESPRLECYICCTAGSPGDELVRDVCLCRTTAMHLRCQRQMLEASLAQSLSNGVACRVCHTRYQNAELRVSWCLSWMGVMWITLPLALGLVLWSALLVISDGGTREVDLLSLRCWNDIVHHLTWWRVVGFIYLLVFLLGLGWVASLLISACASAEGRRSWRQLLQAEYSVHVSRDRIARRDSEPRWRQSSELCLHMY